MNALSRLRGRERYKVYADEKGACPISAMEVFTLCLVIIGVYNLLTQNKKK